MIRVLDEQLVNKIAAGEVIERPVNVIKELVENAVDARAAHITVHVAESLIRVADDGVGMTKEDLGKSILRHATSKIEQYDDLMRVMSFGFRGEALASIAAVSDLTITSKCRDALEGNEIRIEGGAVRSFKPKGCSEGTIVDVRDLFFNTPVRKKFLDTREDERIVAFLEKFSLGTMATVRLIMFDKVVLDISSPHINERIAQVYGTEILQELVRIDYEDFDVQIRGYVSKPSLVRKDKSMQTFFVNGRLIENDEIDRAIYDAYKSLLFVNKHPVVVLALKVKGVDINVHPTKKLVKFTHPDKVYSAVFNALRDVFKEESMVFQVQEKFVPVVQEPTTLREVATQYAKVENKRFVKDTQANLIQVYENPGRFKRFPSMRILGNMAKTFFLAETDEGLMIIDQHVVEERINYEKFMAQYMNEDVSVQELLQPELIEFAPNEAIVVKKNIEQLKKYGFYLEEFGDTTFRLSRVPVLFNQVKGSELLRDLLVDFKEDDKENIITMMSCRKSIKAGDSFSISELMARLKELDQCELPFTCPHGRPIMVQLSIDDLEKMFRRKGF